MGIVVQKFGGSSVADLEKLLQVSKHIIKEYEKGNKIIVVVSAQGKTTDRLVAEAKEITNNPSKRELDVLTSVGEQITISKLSMLLNKLGYKAISMTGWQIPIITTKEHGNAKIKYINKDKINKLLDDNYIVNNHPNLDLDFMKYGYTTLKVQQYLNKKNIDNYMIQVGDLIVLGNNPKKEKYKIGLASPFIDSDDLVQIIRLNNKAIASTNLYQDYYEYSDKVYGKYINPITKYPADNMVGVTVIGDNPADSQMLSRMLFYMTLDDSISYVKNNSDIAAIWYYLDSDGNKKIIRSDQFRQYE